MCGIVGFISYQKSNIDLNKVLINMTNSISHRGPDSFGYNLFYRNDCVVGFGHRRLSIIDLSFAGHQPMFSENNFFCIILNGEIYNYLEIRKELEDFGFSFFSNSDTEVVLKSYIKWGVDCVKKFIGMFAFVIYDVKKSYVYLFRDRVGVKPLYFYWNRDLFMFSSELKAFYKHPDFEKSIDVDSLALFFQYGYIPIPHSIFKNTFKLKPGFILKFDMKNKSLQEFKYWDVIDFYNKDKFDILENDAIDEIEKILISAFKYRTVSDVPVGVFLSGGYDSVAVASILSRHSSQKIKTYTIGFKEFGFDESPYAKAVAKHLGTEHNEHFCTAKDAMDIIPEIPFFFDEPFGDSSAVPTILLSRFARKSVTVALSADGGDEIFAGYSKYYNVSLLFDKLKKFSFFSKFLFSKLINICFNFGLGEIIISEKLNRQLMKLKNVVLAGNIISALKYSSQLLTDIEVIKILSDCAIFNDFSFKDAAYLNSNVDDLNKMLAIDYKTYLVNDILVKIDRATMSVGLEGREPLLDHRIIELVSRIDSSLKFKDKKLKYLLKKIVHKYIPIDMMDRPKRGFEIPVSLWLKKDLKELFFSFVNESSLSDHDFLNKKEILSIRDKFYCGKSIKVEKIWLILMFQMWRKKWQI